jgi:regulatory protein
MQSTSYKIIELDYLRRKKSLCRLTLDNNETLECSLDIVLKHNLHKGQELSEKEFEEVKKEQRKIDVKQAAYNYASYKPRAEQQVRDRLKQRGFSNDEINIGIDFLYQFNLLDDHGFSAAFIKNYLIKKPGSEYKIIAELRKRGISKEIAKNAAKENFPHKNEYSIARDAALTKLRKIQHKSKDKQKRAVADYLQSAGFRWELIKKILDEVFEDID